MFVFVCFNVAISVLNKLVSFFPVYSAMGDFHELKLGFRRVWSRVDTPQPPYGSHAPSVFSVTGTGTPRGVRPYIPSRSSSSLDSPGQQQQALSSPQRPATASSAKYISNCSRRGGGSGGSSGVDGEDDEVAVGPGVRFCHVGVVYDNAFYIFGGYDGTQR